MTLDSIENAAELLKRDLAQSPLVRAFPLERLLGTSPLKIYLKCEMFHATRSFKLRGAYTVLRRLTPEQAQRGVVTRSSGNFAQAVAYAANTLGIKATLVMPTTVPNIKAEGARKFHAEVLLFGTTHAEGEAKVEEIAQREGKTPLSPYDHADVIAGHGTVALEVVRELKEIDAFLCPVGGGGLAAGCALVYKSFLPNGKFIGVEPLGADDYYQSRVENRRVTGRALGSIADGLRAPTVGTLAWPILQKNVDEVTLVTEEEIIATLKILYEEMGLIVEPSAAVSVACLLFHKAKQLKGNVVCVLTGANVDLNCFESWIQSDAKRPRPT